MQRTVIAVMRDITSRAAKDPSHAQMNEWRSVIDKYEKILQWHPGWNQDSASYAVAMLLGKTFRVIDPQALAYTAGETIIGELAKNGCVDARDEKNRVTGTFTVRHIKVEADHVAIKILAGQNRQLTERAIESIMAVHRLQL